MAMRKGLRKQLDVSTPLGLLKEKYEQTKASMRAKVGYPFRVIKQQFGVNKLRYRGIAKNDNKLQTMLALVNPWLFCRTLKGGQAWVRLQVPHTGRKPSMRLEIWRQSCVMAGKSASS